MTLQSIAFSLVVWLAFCIWFAWGPTRNLIMGLSTGAIRSRSGAVARTIFRTGEPRLFYRRVVMQALLVAWWAAAAMVPLASIFW